MPYINKVKPIKFSLDLFKDKRGYLFTLNNRLKKYSINNAVYEYYTYSKKKNIFRGLHFQKPPSAQEKLVIVISGSIIDYVIDIRNTNNFGRIYKYNLNYSDCVWIPKGFCHGYKTKTDNVIINYKVSKKFVPKDYIGIKPNLFNINLKFCEMSNQDKNWKTNLNDLKSINWRLK